MKPVEIDEAEAHFSRVIGLVESGHEVIVQRGGAPVAKIVPFEHRTQIPHFGVLRGQIRMADEFVTVSEGFEGHLR